MTTYTGNAKIDENDRPTAIGISSANGSTVVRLTANASNHALTVDNNTTGSDLGNNGGIAQLDDNGVAVMTCLSSAGDGTLVEVYINQTNGKLLINSN